MKKQKKLELKLLIYLLQEIGLKGVPFQQAKIIFEPDHKIGGLIEISQKNIETEWKTNFSDDEFHEAINKCITNNWIKTDNLNPYCYLTKEGFDVAQSTKIEQSHGLLKQISNYIEERKGIFSILGFIISLLTFYLENTRGYL